MARPTAEAIAERAFNLELLSERELQEVWAAFGSHNIQVDDFLQTAVRRGFLTNYQVERLVKGERSGFYFGDYKIQYLVGTGSFARVFRAVHKNTGQIVAVKALRNRFSEIPSQYGLFLREGELGRSLRHPNIVPIYEVHSIKNQHFFAMEFIEGRNLREFVKVRKSFTMLEATRLMLDIISGLDYAFSKTVTHRDLRMSNVLVSSRGQAKLVDFGLATADEALGAADLDFEMPSTRTIDYAALERATGVRKDDPRSDIYFAGCIYYNMLSGKAPLIEVKNRVQRLSKMRFLEIPPIQKAQPALSHYVTSIVNKAMALDPGRRYQTPGEMSIDLQNIMKRLQEEAPPESAAHVAMIAEKPVAGSQDEGDSAEPQRSVMVVESNIQMQEVFREGLKKAGFRVLVTSDPQRAFDRINQDLGLVDCLLLNAQEVGEAALDTFNRLAEDSLTESVPIILLLGQSQLAWKKRARTADHRVVLSMPITLRDLRIVLAKLLPADSASQSNAS